MAVDQNVRAAAADAEGHVNPLVGDVAVAAVGFERRIKGDGVYVTRNPQSAHKLMTPGDRGLGAGVLQP